MHASAFPVLSLRNLPNEVKVGDTIKIDIYLDNAVDLFALSLVIKYDSNLLKPIGQGIIGGDLPDYYILNRQISDGTITYLATKVGSQEGFVGNIKVGTLDFKAEKSGNATVEIDHGQFVNSQVQKIEISMGTKNVAIPIKNSDGSTSPNPGNVSPKPSGNIKLDYQAGLLSRMEAVSEIQALLDVAGTIVLSGNSEGTYDINEGDINNSINKVNGVLEQYNDYPAEIKSNLKPKVIFENGQVPGFAVGINKALKFRLEKFQFTGADSGSILTGLRVSLQLSERGRLVF